MLLSYFQGNNYNQLTKNIEEIYTNIETIEKKFYKLLDNEKFDMLARVAYFAKTDIIDEIRKNKWELSKAIFIKNFNGQKTLKFAYEETVGKIMELAKTLRSYFSISLIMEDEQTHNKWKQTYKYLDAENSVLKKYPYFISVIGNASVSYVRSADINSFTLYTRDNKQIITYILSELNDKIKVNVKCEHVDFASEKLEKEIHFNLNSDDFKMAMDCQDFASKLYEQLIDKVYSN